MSTHLDPNSFLANSLGAFASTNTYYFAAPKELARVAATWARTNDSTYRIPLKSKTLARAVCLTRQGGKGFLPTTTLTCCPAKPKGDYVQQRGSDLTGRAAAASEHPHAG